MLTMMELERALAGRRLRMRAYFSGGWKVILSGEDTAEIFAGVNVTLGGAAHDAIIDCDQKRNHRPMVER